MQVERRWLLVQANDQFAARLGLTSSSIAAGCLAATGCRGFTAAGRGRSGGLRAATGRAAGIVVVIVIVVTASGQ